MFKKNNHTNTTLTWYYDATHKKLIILESEIQNPEIVILNTNGATVKRAILEKEMDVSELKTGLYICKIASKDNTSILRLIIP